MSCLFLAPDESTLPNGISIGSAVFFEVVHARDQDRPHYTYVAVGRMHWSKTTTSVFRELPVFGCDLHVPTLQRPPRGHSRILVVYSAVGRRLFVGSLPRFSHQPGGCYHRALSEGRSQRMGQEESSWMGGETDEKKHGAQFTLYITLCHRIV